MEENELKVGDVVWLKSGSPKMTIKEYHIKDKVVCQWFEGYNLHNGDFSPQQLTTKETKEQTNIFGGD